MRVRKNSTLLLKSQSETKSLIDLNGDAFKGITAYPELIHGDIETQDLSKLGMFVKDMVGIGAITPDENMEDFLRMTAGLPERDPATAYMNAAENNSLKDDDSELSPAVGDCDNRKAKRPDDKEE